MTEFYSDHVEVISVIKKLHLYFTTHAYGSEEERHRVEVYDGSMRQKVFYGETKDEIRKKAVKWVHENYDVPLNLEESDLLYHLSTDEEE